MPDLTKIIKGLECCAHEEIGDCENCTYNENTPHCDIAMMRDALALLKAQEPRVLTLEELQSIGKTWNSNMPPFLWLEIFEVPKDHIHADIWVPWEVIYDTLTFGTRLYNADNYIKSWRCWNLCPTEEQRKAVKWE